MSIRPSPARWSKSRGRYNMMTHATTPHQAGLIFLSHSSADKAFVERVLKDIPTSHVFYDKVSIDPATHNLETMEQAVMRTNVFVLFFSENSLKSPWVGFETTLARVQAIRKPSFRVLAIPIAGASYTNAPKWMRDYFTTTIDYTAKDIARTIWSLLVESLQETGAIRPELFLGRESFCNGVVVDCITKTARTSTPINFVIFAGLEQMGRTSCARHIAPRLFPGARTAGPLLELPPFADALDLFLGLRDQIDDEIPSSVIRTRIPAFNAMLPIDQAKTIAGCLKHFALTNHVVMVRSSFGLRNRTTSPKEWVVHLMNFLRVDSAMRIVWISERLLPPEHVADHSNVAQYNVPELDDGSVFLLLHTRLGIEYSNIPSLKKLTRQVGGHGGLRIM
jgi:hypothetical protein